MAETKLTEQQERFLAWSATPENERVPRTQAQLGDELGLGHDTLRGWKHTVWFREELARAYAKRNASPERMQAVLDTLWSAAVNGDTRAASQYMEHLRSIGALKVTVEDRRIEDMSDEELQDAWDSAFSD